MNEWVINTQEMINLIPESVLYTDENKFLIMYLWPSVPMVLHVQIQSTWESKIFQKSPNSKTWITCMPASIYMHFYNCLHSIHIVLAIVSNLDMI